MQNMSDYEIDYAVRQVFANLFDRPESAKLVAEDIGLPLATINFGSTMDEYWSNIWKEAKKHNKELELIERALNQYPKRNELIQIRDQIRQKLSLPDKPDIQVMSIYTTDTRPISEQKDYTGFKEEKQRQFRWSGMKESPALLTQSEPQSQPGASSSKASQPLAPNQPSQPSGQLHQAPQEDGHQRSPSSKTIKTLPLLPSRLEELFSKSGLTKGIRLPIAIFIAIITFIAIIIFVASLSHPMIRPSSPIFTPSPTPTPDPRIPPGIGTDGIGVQYADGEYIGISDGRYPLDISPDRPGRDLKIEASVRLRANDSSAATGLWQQDSEADTNDAEPLIYIEDQRVVSSGNPYITIVVGVLLSTNPDGYSRDCLQAAYIAQKEYNATISPGGVMLRLLIAKSGKNEGNSTVISKQIVQAAQVDKTIVGVFGWPTSATSYNAIPALANAHIPMISSGANTDRLTGISPYFFRVSPSNSILATHLATYVKSNFNPKRVLIFVDNHDIYSQSLAQDFANQFNTASYPLQMKDCKEESKPLSTCVSDTLKDFQADVVLFASKDINDMKTYLKDPSSVKYILMGGGAYEVTDTDAPIAKPYERLYFSSPAFPDEWAMLAPQQPEPPFFKDYPSTFDPQEKHRTDAASPYGYSRPNAIVMLGYDAIETLLAGSQMILNGGNHLFTPEQLQQALKEIKGPRAYQGITGRISFGGTNGDPIDKFNLILHLDMDRHHQVVDSQGCFLKAHCPLEE